MGIPKKNSKNSQWQELKLPQENPTSESRDPERNWSPKPPENPLPPWAASRNPTDSDPELWPSEKSENTKEALTFWLENFPSRYWLKNWPTRRAPTLDSKLLPFTPFKRQSRPTWLVFSRTPTFAPSTPEELPSWSEMLSWLEESEVRNSTLTTHN